MPLNFSFLLPTEAQNEMDIPTIFMWFTAREAENERCSGRNERGNYQGSYGF